MGRLEGRVAVVTGAGGGIGRAVAGRLGAEGATVVCADLTEDAAAPGVAAAGGDSFALAGDVTDEAGCRAVVTAALERLGAVDVLVNVAGIGRMNHFRDLTRETWDRTLAVNLTGTMLMCQAALPALLETRGNIVNIASAAGLRPTPYNAAYCTSKAGVIMLTRVLAIEHAAAGLRANCVCPSAVDTPFLAHIDMPGDVELDLLARRRAPLGRMIEPDEVAAAVAYLASDDAAMVTGHTLVLDGGANL